MIKRLVAMRRGGMTKRFHTEFMIGSQSVAEHSFGVACLVTILTPSPSAALLKAALFHDLGEQLTGDVPAPVKWQNPELKELLNRIENLFHEGHDHVFSHHNLTAPEKTTLKWADSLELLCTCYEQRKMGNQYMDTVFWKVSKFLRNGEAGILESGIQLLLILEDEYAKISK